jgi:hypothetical protein
MSRTGLVIVGALVGVEVVLVFLAAAIGKPFDTLAGVLAFVGSIVCLMYAHDQFAAISGKEPNR